MLMIAIFSILYIILLYLDFRKIFKKDKVLVNTIYLVFILSSYVLIVLNAFRIKIPNPTDFIERLVRVFI